jgi:hypothetical protein
VKYICATCSRARQRRARSRSITYGANYYTLEVQVLPSREQSESMAYALPGQAHGGAKLGQKGRSRENINDRTPRARMSDGQRSLTVLLIRRDSQAWLKYVLPGGGGDPLSPLPRDPRTLNTGTGKQWAVKNRGRPFLQIPRRVAQATYDPTVCNGTGKPQRPPNQGSTPGG